LDIIWKRKKKYHNKIKNMTGSKIINGIVGVIIAVVLSMLLTLGIKVFYPEPQNPYENYISKPIAQVTCDKNDKQCIEDQQKVLDAQYEKEHQMQETYNNEMKAYERNLFIIANILGILFFLIGMGLLSIYEKIGMNVIAGILAAGGFGIFYGYIRGWQGADDKIKFGVGVLIAIMVVVSAIFINNLVRKHNLSK
jgi:hypothetical protein